MRLPCSRWLVLIASVAVALAAVEIVGYRYVSRHLIVSHSQSWTWGYNIGLAAGRSDVGRQRHSPGRDELHVAAGVSADYVHAPVRADFIYGFEYGYLGAYGVRPKFVPVK